jgi:quinohemoprotein amine dehydrogenase
MSSKRRMAPLAATVVLAMVWAPPAQGQRDTTPGYPIHNETIVAQCGACHQRDSTGRLSRISYMRKTPEGWETSIRRMVTLNGVTLDPDTARAILRYLADRQGLAPEEMRPGRFEAERRMVEYAYAADTTTHVTCRACHSMGRVITQRRTRDEWSLLVAMHRGYYPVVDFQGFRRAGPPGENGEDAKHPMDQAIAHLAKAFPLETPEWGSWSATMRVPRLDGTWLLTGYDAGRGSLFGRLTVAPGSAPGEFTTRATYRNARGGAVTRTGRAVVYTGFQWRGRSAESGDGPPWREVMFLEPGWTEMSGRWFRGDYDEIGIDVTLRRLGTDAVVAGVHPRGIRSGATHDVEVYGANLGRGGAADLDFGPGVRVERVLRWGADAIAVRLVVDSGATVGARDLVVSRAALPRAVVVYDTVSRIRVTPAAGMARVGGARFPKQFQQFEAIAYHDGPDAKAGTADDLEIGPVDVTWTLEEYGVTYDDDDLRYVGTLDARGLFTPALDGPNPERRGNRNNIGDVWVVATYTPDPPGARPLSARAHLLVTVPLYLRWEPWRWSP